MTDPQVIAFLANLSYQQRQALIGMIHAVAEGRANTQSHDFEARQLVAVMKGSD